MDYQNEGGPLGIGHSLIGVYIAKSIDDFHDDLKNSSLKPSMIKLFNPVNYFFGDPRDTILVSFRNVDIILDEDKKCFVASDLTDRIYVNNQSWLYTGIFSNKPVVLENGRLNGLNIIYSFSKKSAKLHTYSRNMIPISENSTVENLENLVKI